MSNPNQNRRGSMRARDDDRDERGNGEPLAGTVAAGGYWGDRRDRGYGGRRRGDVQERTGYSRGPIGGFDGDFKRGGSMRTGYGQGALDDRPQGQGGHRGKSPVGYQRTDERIWELVCEALTENDSIDATAIEVTVKDGEVTLAGKVPERYMKRMAEDCVEGISGVKDVQNQLKVGG